ncbi:MAG: hypothetical protein FJ298_07575 [Planctomycetes bacterium]|nr:hypothetical protein [Planctomycetota bacterium]
MNAHRARRGATLLEVVIATGCLTLLLGAIGAVAQRGRSAAEAGVSAAALSARAQRLVDRIASELMNATAESLPLAPAVGRATVQVDFRTVEGFDVVQGEIEEGVQRRIARVPSPEDPNDGIDNDGDGLVDEGQVVLVLDTASTPSRELVLASDVTEVLEGEVAGNNVDDNGNGLIDEGGLSLQWRSGGTSVAIGATVGARGAGGGVLLRTVSTIVHLRN